MAAPVVTRPPAATFHKEEAAHGLLSAATAAQWAKWVVVVLLGAGLIALLVVAIVTWQQQSRTEKARRLWDQVYEATKDKGERPEERIAALEAVADKVKGSITHAYVLMELAGLHFDQAVDAARSPADRAAALTKATALYKLVAASEPYASNPYFGPLAVEGEALSLEQAQDYDAAISLLEEKLPKMESHFIYNKLSAQLARLYWLRFQKKGDADTKDRDLARAKYAEILRTDETGAWREQAEYIRSLVDKNGKALPDGTPIPPVKPPPPPEAKKDQAKKDEPKKEEPKKDEAKKDEAKKEEPKKDEAKRDEPRKDEAKK